MCIFSIGSLQMMFLCIPSFARPGSLQFFFSFRVISYQPNRVFEFVNLEDKMILFPVVIIIYCINN
jgi:hypothetical protein